jgi:alanyl-tRNA synthetase
MGDVYPELPTKEQHIERVTRAEEERFLETIAGGLERMEELRHQPVISGEDAFKLYDTYGFLLDLTQMIAAEHDHTVDVEGFEAALGQQRRRSRAARKAAAGGGEGRQRSGDWIEVRRRASKSGSVMSTQRPRPSRSRFARTVISSSSSSRRIRSTRSPAAR